MPTFNEIVQPYIDSAELFEKVADQPWAIFLDSGVIDGESAVNQHSDFDVLAIKPMTTLVATGDVTKFRRGVLSQELYGDPIDILKASIPSVPRGEEIASPYTPGALGYFSYDLARQYFQLPNLASDDENLPSMAVGIYSVVLVVDHKNKCSYLVSQGEQASTLDLIEEWTDLIESQVGVSDAFEGIDDLDEGTFGALSGLLEENIDRGVYRQLFKRVREYLVEGDCYQVNLTKQFSAQVSGDLWPTYRYLRNHSPAPFGAYMNLPFAQILSNSPESFLQCRQRQVATSPIKGTRARAHHNKAVDRAIGRSLQLSPKDRAENLMIVDLMRNDLGRCCELGSIKVPHLFELYSFANVHHLISTITGTLREDLHVLDLFKSCFPGGSITGAPKIRAMQIIEELEPTRRGLYCGSIGSIGMDGSMQTSIAIRTIVVKDGIARYSSGGGLVIDSQVEDEYQELLDKAKMMTDALFKNSR